LQKLNIIEKISNEERYLIDYANLINGDFIHQTKILKKKKDLKNFLEKPENGIPVIFPEKLDYFFYSKLKSDKFSIGKNFYLKHLFRLKRNDYIPEKILIKFGLNFSNIVGLKSKNSKKKVKEIINFNNDSKKKIKNLKKKFPKICAFQTRNIPHLGHEEIIKKLLLKFDHVVVNPVLGPKKEGDINYKMLSAAFDFLIKKKYKKKVSFIPIIANMFYAGPYEALHHANLRKSFGFDYFVIGRDHAGAQNAYRPDHAIKLADKYKNEIEINIVTLNGAYLCDDCKKIVIKGDCKHGSKLKNISGTDFRKCLISKLNYHYADLEMQKYLKKFKKIIN
jgi:hypothetical protein